MIYLNLYNLSQEHCKERFQAKTVPKIRIFSPGSASANEYVSRSYTKKIVYCPTVRFVFWWLQNEIWEFGIDS